MKKQLLTGLVAVAALFGTAAGARADIMLTFISVSPPTQGGAGTTYTYTYGVTLTTMTRLVPPPAMGQSGSPGGDTHDLLTMYDVLGLVSGSEVITPTSPAFAGWSATASEQLVGITPFTSSPPDSMTVTNFTFDWVNGTIDNTSPAGLPIATLTFQSTFFATPGTNIYYAAATQRSSTDPDPNGIANNQSQVRGPGIPPATVPEPASLALLLTALPAVGLLARRRKKTA